jgi:PKD repeat protein
MQISRLSYILLSIIAGLILSIGIISSDVFASASCGTGWFNASCGATTPYVCSGADCGLAGGLNSVTTAVGGQLTSKGIAEYAQQIIVYAMGFLSLIAVIYIIYAGFQMVTGGADEEKTKKTKAVITQVIIGIIIMWLAYPIVKWTINLVNRPGVPTVFEWSMIDQAKAANESTADTWADYRDRIRDGLSQMDREYAVSRVIQTNTLQNVKNLLSQGYERLPEQIPGNPSAGQTNRELRQQADTALELVSKNPNNSNYIGNAISRVANFLDRAIIGSITGDISAGPVEGNAPLSVSFRAEGIKDPSGTTPTDASYVWWMRENGGYRRELSRGPSMQYIFTKEGTYTVFLDVVSGSRNSRGKIDTLPLSVSKQITVRPKLGEVILLVNGVNVSNMKSLKISPNIGKMGLILDASASRSIGNGSIVETKWDFGNGNESVNSGTPIIERQIYANPTGYILKLSMRTNDNQTFTKELKLLVMDTAATIKLDQDTGNIGEDISMSAVSYLSDTKNTEYTWQIQDEDGNKIVKTGAGINFKHKFETVGTYIVSLIAKNPNGSVDTDSKLIKIESRNPIVSIDTPRPVAPERPNTIVFDASKSYDPDTSSRKWLTYTWRVNGEKVGLDNLENDGAKWTYTFDSKSTHSISVTVANVYGKITTIDKQFEVTSTLALNMISTPKVVKRGTPISLIGQSANAEYFEWNMGDGSPQINGTTKTVQHIYQKSGIYTVTLTVNRAWGTETNSISRKVYVSDTESPFAVIEASNASNSVVEEKWACGDGQDALVINRSDSTTFSSSNSVDIDGTQGGLSYTWKYFGKARTTSQVSEKFSELGCFPIELTVRSAKNGAKNTTTQYIKLANHLPELTSLTTSVDTAKKDSQKILVKVRANGAVDPDWVITSYTWYYKTESDTEPQNVQITGKNEITFVLPNITEKYYFGVILEDNDGAKIDSSESGQSPTPLVVDNSNGNIYLPLITLRSPQTVINVGEKAAFSADVRTIIPGVNITNKVEYAWDWDGDGRIDEKTTTPTVSHQYTRSGDFNMKLRVTNNGVSNTKFQMIHVRNKIKAGATVYALPDGSLYIMNTSEWSYNQARWMIGESTSDRLSSIRIDSGSTLSTVKLTVSDESSNTDSIDIDLTKPEIISGTGVAYQSYPRAINDTITVKNPSDIVRISLLGNTGSTFAIDTNTTIDSSLDGIADNDADNRDDASYTDGQIYSLQDIANSPKRDHQVRLMTQGVDGKIIASRIIYIVLDYIASTSESWADLSGSGVTGLSQNDRNKLEDLSKMIRELTDTDRIILMQRYNTLVENWNNPFDKAKSLIDIQEGIESSAMDTVVKSKMSKVVDDLLIGDAVATDEVAVAVHLIRDLIPKESPNHDVLITKLAEIESHPGALDQNKALGKEMLTLIQTDTTIPDKYKIHIKNQLSIIINGGSASVSAESTGSTTVTPSTDSGNGILGFIGGFVKVFFIIIAIILVIVLIGFIFYRMSRKDDNIGFQDFLIDSVFHSRERPDDVASTPVSNTVIVPPVSVVTPVVDPLTNYTPPAPPVPMSPVTPIYEPAPVTGVTAPLVDPLMAATTSPLARSADTPVVEHIPDWLKVPSDEEIVETKEIVDSTSIETMVDKGDTTQDIVSPTSEVSNTPILQTSDIPHNESPIPDWIKDVQSTPIEPVVTATPEDTEVLPDWLMSSITKEETENKDESDEGNETKEEDKDSKSPTLENSDTLPPDTPIKVKKAPRKSKVKSEEKKEESIGSTPPTTTPSESLPNWLQ